MAVPLHLSKQPLQWYQQHWQRCYTAQEALGLTPQKMC